jgi:major membrane immunogen (membrane-anchored lipoprotein)
MTYREAMAILSLGQIFYWFGHNFDKTGDTWKGCCPFHESKSGQGFVVYPNKRFQCEKCGFKGDGADYWWSMQIGTFMRCPKEYFKQASDYFVNRAHETLITNELPNHREVQNRNLSRED